MSAPERIPPRSVTTAELLARGELKVRGQIREASNAVLYCSVSYEGREAFCVYKPVAGERPLWDFPDGTLAQREVAAYEVSEATGWGLVPTTVLRDGPYGEGMCQMWIEPSAAEDGEGSSPSWRARSPPRAGRRSVSPRSAKAGRPCSCTPTTSGCGGSPSSTP